MITIILVAILYSDILCVMALGNYMYVSQGKYLHVCNKTGKWRHYQFSYLILIHINSKFYFSYSKHILIELFTEYIEWKVVYINVVELCTMITQPYWSSFDIFLFVNKNLILGADSGYLPPGHQHFKLTRKKKVMTFCRGGGGGWCITLTCDVFVKYLQTH